MRKLVLVLIVLALSGSAARAESVALGVFVGEPLGLDVKLGLSGRGALDIVAGATTIRDGRESYLHLTYLHLLTMARGRSVNVPLRLGLGGAIYGVTEERLGLAARVPLQIGMRFRRSPLELYGELAFVLQLFRDDNNDDDIDTDIDGGIGLRVYF